MAVVWFTGLPCSGKTTLADSVAEELKQKGLIVQRLDGDIVRKTLCKDLGFSKEDRNENIRRVTCISKILSDNGVIVLASFINPYNERREETRKVIGDYTEVFLNCPLNVCIQRDCKGMYKKALNGEIKDFTGISDPYEEPENPEIKVNTDLETVKESTRKIITKLIRLGVISNG